MQCAKFVFAKTTIKSEHSEVRRMNIGYSDEVVVFLNGKQLYAGNNSLGFRQPSYLGLLDPYIQAIYRRA
jgi:hypothetical protein